MPFVLTFHLVSSPVLTKTWDISNSFGNYWNKRQLSTTKFLQTVWTRGNLAAQNLQSSDYGKSAKSRKILRSFSSSIKEEPGVPFLTFFPALDRQKRVNFAVTIQKAARRFPRKTRRFSSLVIKVSKSRDFCCHIPSKAAQRSPWKNRRFSFFPSHLRYHFSEIAKSFGVSFRIR